MWVWFLGWEDPLEEGMETHSSLLAWRIPWTEEPGSLQSIGSHRVGHNWSDLPCMHSPVRWLLNSLFVCLIFIIYGFFFFFWVYLLYSVVLVSGAQQSESVIHINRHISTLSVFRFFSRISHHRVLSKVPCALRQVLISNSLFNNEETESQGRRAHKDSGSLWPSGSLSLCVSDPKVESMLWMLPTHLCVCVC